MQLSVLGQIGRRPGCSLGVSQSILIEFDFEWAPKEGTMIWYFREGLRPSVRVKMEQCGRELDSFEELVEKAVHAEAKAAFRPCSYACETNQHCLRGSQLSAVKTNTQGQPMKDPRVEELKSRPQKSKTPAPQRSDSSETFKQARKVKKKKDKQHWGRKPQESSTPATGVNNTFVAGSQTQKDVSQVICFNCNKKGHYSNKYPKPLKPKN